MSAISSLRSRRLGEARAQRSFGPGLAPGSIRGSIPPPSQPPVSWTPPARLEKKWLVYVAGGEVVGPVSADQIARGIKAGMIPMNDSTSVQQVGEVFWDGILDQPAIINALKSL